MKDFCKPCIFGNFSTKTSHQTFSISNIESAAFEAVMSAYTVYLGQYRYSTSHKKYLDDMLSLGVESIKMKTRFRPIVTGRYLMFNYLKSIGYSAQRIADIYNVDRTSVLHGCSAINSMLKSKFDNDMKDAYIEFSKLINETD